MYLLLVYFLIVLLIIENIAGLFRGYTASIGYCGLVSYKGLVTSYLKNAINRGDDKNRRKRAGVVV